MKTVLVTGASSGIGKATVQKLLAADHRVYAAARRLDKMRELEQLGATTLRMDITQEADVQAVVDRIASERGGVDVLVNNAGFGLFGAMEDTTIADARYQFEVNLFGLARLTQLALPYMRQQGGGTIVNISSMGGRVYTPLGSWYHATKHALEGWSDCLRLELAPFGIHVVIIEPGAIETEFADVMSAPMLERSGHGPYGPMAKKLAKAVTEQYGTGRSSPASLIADTIAKAVHARRPRTRYAVGKFAKPVMFLRKWFGDRIFDWAISKAM